MKTHYVSFLWKKLADFSVDDFLGLPWFFLLYVFYPEKLYTPFILLHKLLNINPIRVKVFSSKPYTQPFTNPTRPVSANSLILRSGASLGVVRNLKKVLGIYRFLFRQFKGLGAIAQDFWTMGNEEEGATLVALDDALEYTALCGGIEGGGGFVEEQDGGWAQQGVTIIYDPRKSSYQDLAKAFEKIGYQIKVVGKKQ